MAVNDASVETGMDCTISHERRLGLFEDCYSRLRLKHFLTNIIQ